MEVKSSIIYRIDATNNLRDNTGCNQSALRFQGAVDLGHGVYPHDAFECEVRHGRVT